MKRPGKRALKQPAKAKRAVATQPVVAGERAFELVTPEGVDLRLRVAGYGERCAALALDLLIMLGLLVGATIIIGLFFYGLSRAGVTNLGWTGQLLSVLWLLGSFILRNLYFIYFELRPAAATPGKRALGLRVAVRSGGRLTADAVIARNAMREIEVYLPLSLAFARAQGVDGGLIVLGLIWSGVFALFPLFNRNRLRLGDLAGGTMVIKAPRQTLRRDLADAGWSAGLVFTDAQLDAYGIKELQVLEQVLRQNDRKAIGEVSMRIRKKIGWDAPLEIADQAFLKAYYEGLRARLEQRLLFGHRRVDKFDRV